MKVEIKKQKRIKIKSLFISLRLWEVGERCLFLSSFFQVSRIISSLEDFFISAGIFNKTFPGFAPKLQLGWSDPNQRLVKKAPSTERATFLLPPTPTLEILSILIRTVIGAEILMGKRCLII